MTSLKALTKQERTACGPTCRCGDACRCKEGPTCNPHCTCAS